MRRVGVDDQQISQLLTDQMNRLTEDDKKYLGEVFLPDFREIAASFSGEDVVSRAEHGSPLRDHC